MFVSSDSNLISHYVRAFLILYKKWCLSWRRPGERYEPDLFNFIFVGVNSVHYEVGKRKAFIASIRSNSKQDKQGLKRKKKEMK